MPEVDFSHLTDVGCVREANEDAIGSWPCEDGLVFAVADGLGGHNAGEVASALALEVLAEELHNSAGTPVAKRLKSAVQEANLRIYTKATTVPELRRMGTTLTATAVVGDRLIAAHVGDCRLYLLRNGTLTQLTKDHTWVWEQVQYGILSPEEARTHPKRHMLSRALGQDLIVSIDTLTMNVQPGDVLVQCSDGIHALLSDTEIRELLTPENQPDAACRALIRRGCERGGDDNLSVQIACVVSCSSSATRQPWWRFGR
jgi:PPM family protein phosphatase